MALSFWLVFVAAVAVVAATGHAMTARWHLGPVEGLHFWTVLAFSPEILVFLFFMLTDPKTVPAGREARIVFAVAVALLAALLVASAPTEFWAKVGGAGGARGRLRGPAARAHRAVDPACSRDGSPRSRPPCSSSYVGALVAAGLQTRAAAADAAARAAGGAAAARSSIAPSAASTRSSTGRRRCGSPRDLAGTRRPDARLRASRSGSRRDRGSSRRSWRALEGARRVQTVEVTLSPSGYRIARVRRRPSPIGVPAPRPNAGGHGRQSTSRLLASCRALDGSGRHVNIVTYALPGARARGGSRACASSSSQSQQRRSRSRRSRRRARRLRGLERELGIRGDDAAKRRPLGDRPAREELPQGDDEEGHRPDDEPLRAERDVHASRARPPVGKKEIRQFWLTKSERRSSRRTGGSPRRLRTRSASRSTATGARCTSSATTSTRRRARWWPSPPPTETSRGSTDAG